MTLMQDIDIIFTRLIKQLRNITDLAASCCKEGFHKAA
jgi:hypothetical protein